MFDAPLIRYFTARYWWEIVMRVDKLRGSTP